MSTYKKPKSLEGKEARWEGKAEEDNPYIPDDYAGKGFPNEDAEEWHDGYCEARDEEEGERDDAS